MGELLVLLIALCFATFSTYTSAIPLQFNPSKILGQSKSSKNLKLFSLGEIAFNGVDMLYVIYDNKLSGINLISQEVLFTHEDSIRSMLGITCLRKSNGGSDIIYYSGFDGIWKLDRDVSVAAVRVAGKAETTSWNGDGRGLDTILNRPRGLFAIDRNGGELYFADEENHIVRKLSLVSNNITTVAGNRTAGYNGDGLAILSMLNYPRSVHVSPSGEIYIADTFNCRLRRVNLNGMIETIAGTNECGFDIDGKSANNTKLNYPYSIRFLNGQVFFSDTANGRIKMITTSGLLKTIAGGGYVSYVGVASLSILYNPTSIDVSPSGQIYLSESGNQRVLMINRDYDSIQVTVGYSPNTERFYIGMSDNIITLAETFRSTSSYGIALDKYSNVYFSESFANRILKLETATGKLKRLVGSYFGVAGFSSEIDGKDGRSIELNFPQSLAMSDDYESLFISDTLNHRVIRLNISSGTVQLFAGNGTAGYNGEGLARNCQLNNPNGLYYYNGDLYIADTYNRLIRKVSNGMMSNINYLFKTPTHILFNFQFYVSDTDDRKIITLSALQSLVSILNLNHYPTNLGYHKGNLVHSDPENGKIGPFIGSTPGFVNKLRNPSAFVSNKNGTMFICDSGNGLIRKYEDEKLVSIAGYGAVYPNYEATDPKIVSISSNLVLDGQNLILYSQDDNLVLKYNFDTKIVLNIFGPCLGDYYNSVSDKSNSKFSGISGVLAYKGSYYLTDYYNNRIRFISGSKTFNAFGSGNSIVTNPFTDIPTPKLLIEYKENDLLLFSGNTLIRYSDDKKNITRIAGEGTDNSNGIKAVDTSISSATALFYDKFTDSIYYGDYNKLRKINSNGIVTTVFTGTLDIRGIYVNTFGDVYFLELTILRKLAKNGKLDIIYSGLRMNSLIYRESTNDFFISDSTSVYKISVNCPNDYFISNLTECLPICFGKNSTSACGGTDRGECVSPNQCNCTSNYSGSDCSQLRIVPETSKNNPTDNSTVLIATLVPIFVVLLLIIVVIIIVTVIIVFCLQKKKRNSNKDIELIESKQNITMNTTDTSDFPDSEVSTFFRPTMEFQSVSTSAGNSSSSSSFDPLSRYKNMVKIGSGGFGSVFKALDIRSNSIKALKVIQFQSYSELNQFMKEGLQLLNMTHSNIIKVNDMFVDKSELLVIEMDYYEKGDLSSLLKIQPSERMLKSIALQILRALEYIHEEKKLIHRDVKESNIFIKEMEGERIDVVLADFGLARDNSLSANASYCGTPMFLSPELGLGASYGFNTDVYSLGVTLYQLMTHDTTTAISHLYFTKDTLQVKQILTENMQKAKLYSQDLIQIVLEMLEKDSSIRPQASQLVNHSSLQ